jgi:membrane-anchored mycosin MYCP
MAIANGRVEAFHDDQLVVALADLDLLAATLGRLGVGIGRIHPDTRLGLALIPGLTDIPSGVEALGRNPAVEQGLAAYVQDRASQPGAPAWTQLDLLLKGLRIQFDRQYQNWLPMIGKNHVIAQIAGSPHIGGGSVGDPLPTQEGLEPRDRGAAGGRGVRVGLLDTRIYPAQWLAGGYFAMPADLISPSGDLKATQAHGTAVASRILNRAPAAEIHLTCVLNDYATGDTWAAANAMAGLASAGLDVVNLSFGEYFTDDGNPPLALAAAAKLLCSGSVVVAAAGNHGNVSALGPDLVPQGLEENSPSYPAALPDVVAVGALDANGKPADFSPKRAPWISLMAPGVDLTVAFLSGNVLIQHKNIHGKIISSRTEPFTGWARYSGTSFAAAIVSGEIAARTIPGHRTARQALDTLRHPDVDRPGNGIQPHVLDC